MSKPLRVLLVEDSEADAQLLLFELRRGGYEPTYIRVDTAEGMDQALDGQVWDVILADYKMPEFDGLAALELLKAKGIDIPFIVVSGAIGEDIAVAAMKAGASDYLMKTNLTRLVPAVERELREAEARRERRRAEEERDRLVEQLRNVNEQVVISSIQLQDKAAELEAIIAALAEAVVVCGPAGEILYLNAAAESLLGYTTGKRRSPVLEQMAQLHLQTPDGRPFALEKTPTARALRGETVRGVVAVIPGALAGKPICVSISAAPLAPPSGQSQGAVTIFTDVTALTVRPGTAGPEVQADGI